MNTRINPNKIKVIAAIFIAAIAFIVLLGAGFATAGVVKYVSANLSGFLPLIMNRSAVETTTSNALIIFSSVATTDGNAGGRTGMDEICMSEDPASHLCSLAEIENAWVNRGVSFQSPFYRAWIDYPTLGSIETNPLGPSSSYSYIIHGNWEYNNRTCMGWASNDIGDYGVWIDNNATGINIEYEREGNYIPALCNEVHPVTCCKSAP
jgi:hypothetical protein